MAGRVTPPLRLLVPLLCAALGAVAPARAQLADPTKPPAAIAAPVTPAADASPRLGLQSIILRQGGKPAALIDGAVVEQGDMVGEARVAKIGEDHVVLKGPEGETILRLMPAAEKKEKLGAGGTAVETKSVSKPAKPGKAGDGGRGEAR